MLYALIGLCLFGGASAQVYGIWRCPETVKPMTNFDPRQLKGRWFKVRRYPMPYTLFSQCPWADYKLVEDTDDHIQLVHGAYYVNKRITLELGGEAHAPNISERGKLVTTFIWNAFKRDYWVLDTDYKDYLVIYSCRSFFFLLHWQYVFILTRKPKPSDYTVATTEDVLDRNLLQTSKLQIVDRDDCSEVDVDKDDD